MGKYFGTDGVRGIANAELTPELAYKLGRIGAHVLTYGRKRPALVVGRDTRISGHLLETAITAGILSIGADVIQVGVISTPGVAYLTQHIGADAGIMISASHNPVEDNGIKFFGRDGFKLSDEMEEEIECLLDREVDQLPRPVGPDVGSLIERKELKHAYLAHLNQTVSQRFTGFKVVLDCANGAASDLAPDLFRQLGAETIVINNEPDGVNINVNCGSTHPEQLQAAVVRKGADVGLAFDGDADRLIAVDETGAIVDGDSIMCILGVYLKEEGQLEKDTVVTTVMSNIGLHRAAAAHGIRTVQTDVGDRYVMEAMRDGGYTFGGEQSGHIIFLAHSTSGDGILTAVQLLNVLKAKQKPLSALADVMKRYPQVMVNARVKNKTGWAHNEAIREAIKAAEDSLGSEGRILVRPSGTEPLIRIMAEGQNEAELRQCTERIADVVRRELA